MVDHFLQKVHFEKSFVLVGHPVALIVNDVVHIEVGVDQIEVIDYVVGNAVIFTAERRRILEIST